MNPWPADVRHAIRGRLNAIKLCISAFQCEPTPQEAAEFARDIETAADGILKLLDEAVARPASESDPIVAAAAPSHA